MQYLYTCFAPTVDQKCFFFCLPSVSAYSVGDRELTWQDHLQLRLLDNGDLQDNTAQKEHADVSKHDANIRKNQKPINLHEDQLLSKSKWNLNQEEETDFVETGETNPSNNVNLKAISPPKYPRYDEAGNGDKDSRNLKTGTEKQFIKFDLAGVSKIRNKRDAHQSEPFREVDDAMVDDDGGNHFSSDPPQMISQNGDNGSGDWTRIIDGRPTHPDRWPWTVALVTEEYGFICGGVLILRDWVMTSAHCVDGAK